MRCFKPERRLTRPPSAPRRASAPGRQATLRRAAAHAPARLRRTPPGFGLFASVRWRRSTPHACCGRSGHAAFTAVAINPHLLI
ncbi:hypothetical protein ABC99_10990 [Salmonella enterica]|uniref:Uncharacterized protein n=1 Tax=Salmonella enterica TaxID=28901 RepID=A0A5U3R9K9_SALER|nr:hypothetical protein [Salmonella enterica]EBP6409663.1 hypothetical protein [Salmonella enterica]EBP7111278.1 hypothetical protein [Salmonella enterica]